MVPTITATIIERFNIAGRVAMDRKESAGLFTINVALIFLARF